MKKKEIFTCREGNFFFLSGNAGPSLRPVHTYADIFENGVFFLRFGVASTRKRRFRHAKTEVFENALQSGGFRKRRFRVYACRRVKTEVFENAVFVFTCELVKTEVFENDDVIIGSSL